MAQVMVNFRMDEDLKKRMEHACAEMGLSMTTAFTIFARKVANEQRIPFEVSVDHFYSQSNMEYPTAYVQERFAKIGQMHIEKVLAGIESNTTQVKNTKAYLLAALFNAPSTLDNHYAMQVNHDMAAKEQ